MVVIGAGPGGELAVSRLAEQGLRVALCERELIGGECGYWACIRSKTLISPQEARAHAARSAGTDAPEQRRAESTRRDGDRTAPPPRSASTARATEQVSTVRSRRNLGLHPGLSACARDARRGAPSDVSFLRNNAGVARLPDLPHVLDRPAREKRG